MSTGQSFVMRRFVLPAADETVFSTALSRSVTGSMNDLIQHAKWYLAERRLGPLEAARELDRLPMSCLRYLNPGEVFRRISPE